MPPDTYACPECQAPLRLNPELRPGDLVQCPRCRTQFPVPDTGAFRPAEDIPLLLEPSPHVTEGPPARPRYEEEPLVTDRPSRPPAREWDEDYPRPSRDYRERTDPLSADYSIDLNQWFEQASTHWGTILGPGIGFAFVYLAIYLGVAIVNAIVPLAGPLLSLLVLMPLGAGWTVVALAQLKGKSWTFNDFFGGFNWWGPLVLNALLQGLILVGCAVPAGIVALISIGPFQSGAAGAGIALLIAAGVFALCLLVYIGVRVSFFAVPLIIDRNFGPAEAIQGSWELSRGHFWGLFLIAFLVGLINMAGALPCGIGLLFTIPFTTLLTNAGYLLATGRQPSPPAQDRERAPNW
jgi:hypothetical protein